MPGAGPADVEFVAEDVPAFGWRHYTLQAVTALPDEIDNGGTIEADNVTASVADDGTLCVRFADREFRGLLAIDDQGDRGDTYDFDAAAGGADLTLGGVSWRRIRHASGIQRLEVERTFSVPAALDSQHECRSHATVPLTIRFEAAVAPRVPRVDITVHVQNTARDHRLRLLFPTEAPAHGFHAATTFDVARRSTAPPDATRWVHPAPLTFAHHGWISANGRTVVASGLPEAEVTASGTIAVTLLRAIGWLARFDLRSRPVPAGPFMTADAAQLQGDLRAQLSLLAGMDPAAAYDTEIGLRGVLAGPGPLLPPGASLLRVEPTTLLLSAVKPAEDGDGVIVRVLNPTDERIEAILHPGFPVTSAVAVRLDEQPMATDVVLGTKRLTFPVPAHALRSVLLR